MSFSKTVSSLEFNIMRTVKSFLDEMTDESKNLKESTPEYGNKILSEAIAKGISTALLDPSVNSAFSIIVDTNAAAVIPIGVTAYTALSTSLNAKAIPNPNLSP